MEGGKMSEVHAVTIAEAVETMRDWLARHYHERDNDLYRDPVAVYAQKNFSPEDVFCYQELRDWVAENAEVAEVFPEYVEAHAALLTACRAAVDQIVEMEPHWEPLNERPVLVRLRDAIRKARGHV